MDASSKYQDSLPLSSDALLALMRENDVAFDLYEHVPLRTVEDAKQVQGVDVPSAPGRIDIKNFYLRDRKKRNHLVVLEQDRDIDLKTLGTLMGAAGLSFGSADRLMEFLGIRPGAVSPLAMVTGTKTNVQLWLDPALKLADWIHAHPLVNDRTVAIRPLYLVGLLESWGTKPMWLEL